jgi:glycosyltransferase involved in cell wall biosynthesis
LELEVLRMTDVGKSLVWVIDGSLSEQLHKTARLNPASALCDLGWDVTMIVAGVPSEEVDSRLKFIVLPWPNIYILGSLIYHVSILWNVLSKKVSCDVLMFQTDYAAFLLPTALWRKLLGWQKMKIVMDTRSMPMDTTTIRGKIRALGFKLSHWIAKHLPIGQTAITKEMVRTVGIPNKQLLGIWPSGVNVDEFAVSISLRQWPCPDDPIRLVYIGVLHSERNLIAAIDAVLLAKRQGQNVALEVVGDGPQRGELEEYTRSMGDGTIKISSPVPHREIPLVLARGDIGLLPFPDLPKMRVASFIKLFEYMAAGMPMVATRIVAHTDVLEDADFVFWADDATPESIASAIREACSRKLELPKLADQACIAAQNCTWESSAKKLSAALLKAIHNCNNP